MTQIGFFTPSYTVPQCFGTNAVCSPCLDATRVPRYKLQTLWQTLGRLSCVKQVGELRLAVPLNGANHLRVEDLFGVFERFELDGHGAFITHGSQADHTDVALGATGGGLDEERNQYLEEQVIAKVFVANWIS
ncbi:hypothetical protein VP1G_02260 [Cytospora mali]|uniref:Uncharacterized protein n=1 Tax=Cytospora mali TaxID=578113 RepID=A0A194UT56_CYTMA|nr:hypothetical protein VP1G_02260 [Valsa mali var. pyri (nom. inval.)]